MSSWCLVSQLPRTLPRAAPLRILALAQCRRCLCPQADSEPSARSRMARPTAVRVGRPQVSCPVVYMHICAKCVHTYINMSRHVCTHMSSWCLVAQLPRTLPRGAPLRILALARWRRCLCPLADTDPIARSRMARPAAVRVFWDEKNTYRGVMARWSDRVRFWFDWI